MCRPKTDHYQIDDLPYIVLKEVRDMLVADKVQNYKDFLLFHKDTHERSNALDKYFNLWIDKLDAKEIFNDFYNNSFEVVSAGKAVRGSKGNKVRNYKYYKKVMKEIRWECTQK